MKLRSGKAKLPKAYRDAFVRAPSTARDPEGVTTWLSAARLLAGMALVAMLSWVRWRHPMGNAALAGLVAACGTLIVFAPARWFVPRKKPRAAFRMMRLLVDGDEGRAAAVTMAALALATHPPGGSAVASEIAFLDEEMAHAEPRGSEGVLAYALLRALRGDHESARLLFGMMLASAPTIFSRFARRIARTWLAADHLRRGQRVDAEALLLAARPPRWRAWLSPPARTFRQLAKLAAAPPVTTTAVANAPPNDPLAHALCAHKFWLVDAVGLDPRERDAALLRVGKAWDALPVEFEELLATAISDLASSAVHAGITLGAFSEKSRTLERANDIVVERLFTDVSEHLQALQRRVDADARGSEIEEWLEWASAQQLLARAHRLGGERVRRGTFASAYKDLTHYAAWLYNQRHLFLLSHAIFRWLLREARAMGDEDAIRLCWKNSNIRPD
jgi:hypothetical protein